MSPDFCYLILAHTDLDHLDSLVDRILGDSRDAQVVIHLDRKTIGRPRCTRHGRVHLVEVPRDITWGDYSMVEAELHSLAWCVTQLDFDWLAVISGHDYPVSSLSGWQKRLRAGDADAVIDMQPVTIRPAWGRRRPQDGTFVRYAYRWTRLPRLAGLDSALRRNLPHLHRAVLAAFACIEPLAVYRNLGDAGGPMLGLRASHPFSEGRPCMKGSQWMALNRLAVQELLASEQRHPDLVATFRRSLIPDEAMFHTLLSRNPAVHIQRGPITLTSFPDGYAPHPEPVTCQMVDEARRQGLPFARKFVGELRDVAVAYADAACRTLPSDRSDPHG